MNNCILKAMAKKKKFKKDYIKVEQYRSDSDGSISSDDIDELETNFLGQIINEQYIIIKYIGRGTFSKVWLIYDLIQDSFVIFKIYFPDDKSEFDAELKTLQQIKLKSTTRYNINYEGHLQFKFPHNNELSNILILPYLGMSLSDVMKDKEQISLSECKYIIKQILISLSELHQNQIVHTDLKLDNILSTYYFENNTEFIEWFKILNIINQYKSLYVLNSPPEEKMLSLDKNKRKMMKRKIRKRTFNALSIYVKKQLTNYEPKIIGLNEVDLNIHNISLDNSSNFVEEDNKNNDKKQEQQEQEEFKSLNQIEKINIDELEKTSKEKSEQQKTDYSYDIEKIKFILTDYSNATYISDIDEEDMFQIRAYRSPEDILGFKYSYKSELWAVGCIMWDLLTDDYIFEPELEGSSLSRDRKQLALMEKYLGRMPKDMSLECDRSNDLYESSGRIKKNRKIDKENLENILVLCRDDLTEKELTDTCNFLRKIWTYDPKLRMNINQVLNDGFL
jgi:serine/threonine-protein kinase SRPK3